MKCPHWRSIIHLVMMNQVYREFSRQKYNKYKHQFPKMRESQIVSRIIKEWDSLGKEAKEKLHLLYENHKFIKEAEQSQPESAPNLHKGHDQLAYDKTADKDTLKTEPKQEQQDSREHSEKDSLKSLNQHTTPRPKPKSFKRNDYITFYKFYFQKYSREHQKWRPAQVSKVISLLWEKRKKQCRKLLVRKDGSPKPKKTVNGRKLFKKIHKLVDKHQASEQWRRLPKESRILWSLPDKTYPQGESHCRTLTFKCAPETGTSKLLGFLNKLIR